MMRGFIALLWTVFIPAGIAGEAEWKLDASREIYQGKLEHIGKEYGAEVASLLDKYRNALGGLKSQAQREGDLKGVLAVDEELKRLGSDNTPPAGKNFSSDKNLREKQTICARAARDMELAMSRKIVDQASEYMRHLAEEKKRLTIAGKFDAAKAYADEIERITSGESERAATRIVKAATSKDSGAAAEPQGTAATRLAGDCRIYKDVKPPPIEGVDFKEQSLHGTRLGGRISRVIAIAGLATIDNMVEKRDRSGYIRSKTESGEIKLILRLELKTQGRDHVIRDPLVIVQYFATDLAARGIVKPKQIDAEPVRLSELSGGRVTIDYPSISLKKYEYRSFSGNYSSKSGQQFHGLMVTVFAADQEILYQGVTNISLQDHGELALAEAKLAQSRIDLRTARLVYEQAREAYHAGVSVNSAKREELHQQYDMARARYYELRSRLRK